MSLPKQYLNKASGIEHQKSSNWCTNHAVSSLVEAQSGKWYGNIATLSNSWGMMLSKKVDGRPDSSATPIEDIMDEVCEYGMCTEALYPTWDDKDYHDNVFLPTTTEMYNVAKKYRPKKRVDLDKSDIEGIKQAVVENGGCVLIVRVYKEHTFPTEGCVLKPEKGSEPDGLHAIWLAGYIENSPKTVKGQTYSNWFILQESYGSTRGYKGYLFVPYEAFTEDWTGYYSADKYIKSVHTFVMDDNAVKYPTYHDNNPVVFPRKTIELTINSKNALVEGVSKKLDYPPIEENGTTLVPFRFLCESLEYTVRYESDTKTITAYSQMRNQLITMKVGSVDITSQKGGTTTQIKSPVKVKQVDGYTLIPLRAFSELTGAKVDYNKGKITIAY